MKNIYEAYCSLGDDTSSQGALELPGSPPKEPRVYPAEGISRTLPVVLCPASLFENGFLGVCIFKLREQLETPGVTQFAGLTFDEPVPYESHKAYNSENQMLANELWNNLQPVVDAGLVALTEDYAKANDLLYAQRSPWQDGMDTYFLNRSHSVHRLRNVRWAFFEYRNGEPQSAFVHHINHCMETIRQDLMCFMDDPPCYTGTTGPMESGVDQMHMCQSWDKLQGCAKEHTVYFGSTDEGHQAQRTNQMRVLSRKGGQVVTGDKVVRQTASGTDATAF